MLNRFLKSVCSVTHRLQRQIENRSLCADGRGFLRHGIAFTLAKCYPTDNYCNWSTELVRLVILMDLCDRFICLWMDVVTGV